jgi:hypothetical protein
MTSEPSTTSWDGARRPGTPGTAGRGRRTSSRTPTSIDDRDLATKRNFALLMLLFSLVDTGDKKGVPLLTIPAQ